MRRRDNAIKKPRKIINNKNGSMGNLANRKGYGTRLAGLESHFTHQLCELGQVI